MTKANPLSGNQPTNVTLPSSSLEITKPAKNSTETQQPFISKSEDIKLVSLKNLGTQTLSHSFKQTTSLDPKNIPSESKTEHMGLTRITQGPMRERAAKATSLVQKYSSKSTPSKGKALNAQRAPAGKTISLEKLKQGSAISKTKNTAFTIGKSTHLSSPGKAFKAGIQSVGPIISFKALR